MKLLLFPIRLVLGTTFFTVRTGTRTSRGTLRVLGVRGVLGLGAGVAVGLLVAPRTGAETRRRLRERYERWQSERQEITALDLDAPSLID